MLVIIIILSVFFVLASWVKLFGIPEKIFTQQMAFFKNYGLNRFHMRTIGLIELTAVVLLWIPGLSRLLGAAALCITSVGALYFHFRFDSWTNGIPALCTMALSISILYLDQFVF